MAVQTAESVRCPLCSGEKHRLVYRCQKRQISVMRCARCRIVFGAWAQDRGEGENSAGKYTPTHIQSEADKSDITADIRQRIRELVPSGDLLDVGSGLGRFLQLMAKDRAYQVRGIEPGHEAAEHTSKRLGLDVVQGFYGKQSFAPNSFDVITMLQVLEHVDQPQEVLSAAYEHLRPGGLLVVDVPSFHNPRIYLYRACRYRPLVKNDFIRPHVFYYTRATLLALSQAAGFEMADVVCGRYRVKAQAAGLKIGAGLRVIDRLADTLRIGGIVLYTRKPHS